MQEAVRPGVTILLVVKYIIWLIVFLDGVLKWVERKKKKNGMCFESNLINGGLLFCGRTFTRKIFLKNLERFLKDGSFVTSIQYI